MTALHDAVEWPVLTERLVIRPATPDDVEETWRYRRLPDVTEWMSSAPATLEDYRVHYARPDRLGRTLVLEHERVLVGDLMARVENAWAQTEVEADAHGVQAEIGWCLDPEAGGRGLATEAVRALLRVCFESLQLRRVTASCFAANLRSARLMERVGMRREVHAVRESLHRSAGWVDALGYALLAEEWQDQQAR